MKSTWRTYSQGPGTNMLSLRMLLCLCLCSLVVTLGGAQRFLSVDGDQLRLNGQKVFMSGMNIAWQDFGMDFGEGRYDCCTGPKLEDFLKRISENGGNSVRIWIHCDGRMTPKFDNNGFVSMPDRAGSLINDLGKFLDKAREYNILVFPVLWNGATLPRPELMGLLTVDDKLNSYIQKVLRPMVRALSEKQALGGWEIMNEPEGSIHTGQYSNNACYDTRNLQGSGAGWSGANVPMQKMLRFISRQAAAIKEEDWRALVTVGSWSGRTMTDSFHGTRNYYSDACLINAGGKWSGTLDIYQMHSYAHNGRYWEKSPLKVHNNEYKINKPNIIGEFSQDGGDGADITTYINHAYYYGYAGAWTWQANGGGKHSDNFTTQARATLWLKGRNDQAKGGLVNFRFQ